MTLKMVSLVNKSLRNLIADVLFAYVSVDSNTSEMQPGQSYFRLTRGSVRCVLDAYSYDATNNSNPTQDICTSPIRKRWWTRMSLSAAYPYLK